jgi:micrococcal nuclease
MKYLLILSIFFISCKGSYRSVVSRCKDCDTYVLSDNSVIRLSGCDGIELHQFLGYEAKAFAESYLLNKKVQIIRKERDKYGRLVAIVMVDGQDFADILVTHGYACAYRRYCSDKMWNEYLTAKNNKVGLFAYSNWETPASFRHRKK